MSLLCSDPDRSHHGPTLSVRLSVPYGLLTRKQKGIKNRTMFKKKDQAYWMSKTSKNEFFLTLRPIAP